MYWSTLFCLLLAYIYVSTCSPSKSGNSQHVDHESILSESAKPDDKISQMTAEEGRQRLRALAKRMDVNGDDFVDKDELERYVASVLEKIDAEDAEDSFAESDEDKNGFVTWQEHREHADMDKDMDDDEEQKLADEEQTYFKAADFNKDGKLNKEEYLAFKMPETSKNMHDVVINNTFAEKDTDKDGSISLQEYLKSRGSEHHGDDDPEWFATEESRFRDDYDKNGDGFLDRDETKSWVLPDGRETAAEEAEHLLNEADKNGDKKLSYDEMADEYDLFAGSEATNYGAELENLSHDEL